MSVRFLFFCSECVVPAYSLTASLHTVLPIYNRHFLYTFFIVAFQHGMLSLFPLTHTTARSFAYKIQHNLKVVLFCVCGISNRPTAVVIVFVFVSVFEQVTLYEFDILTIPFFHTVDYCWLVIVGVVCVLCFFILLFHLFFSYIHLLFFILFIWITRSCALILYNILCTWSIEWNVCLLRCAYMVTFFFLLTLPPSSKQLFPCRCNEYTLVRMSVSVNHIQVLF